MANNSSLARPSAWREGVQRLAARGGAMLGAIALVLATLLVAIAIASHHPGDPALNTAAPGPTLNWIGPLGAHMSEILLILFGPLAALLLPVPLIAAARIWRDAPADRWARPTILAMIAILLAGSAASLVVGPTVAGLPFGWGGVLGFAGGEALGALAALAGDPRAVHYVGLTLALALMTAALIVWARGLGLDEDERAWLFRRDREPRAPRIATGAGEPPPRPRKAVEKRASGVEDRPRPIISDRASAASRKPKARQGSLDLKDSYTLPSIELLNPVPDRGGTTIDKAGLERNARLLESVLDDFHVQGVIREVRPGPVVTMYELEPASGIKASRVIQLADDVARNMSAMSARVATIPGRSVIGIELPNARREQVVLSELVGSAEFDDHGARLPIILGKNIAGDAVVVDLAPMPHLLVAGTTGSGKSVGLNCMILSLLYKMTPDECRMIMIDPKMLELSIYDDIPHLLSPVVTEPAKAIRALKWAVEQMEDRYRMMASISVRGLAGYNEKVRAAKARGKPLGRRVQTGWNPDTREPLYEEEQLDFEPLPQVVIVVDELADLMMTAGKEVEFLIQRLAQKARAAGIHLIMATQRPSVDVITGVIKANLPTRISFSVTSKIDSRTILGEQGAEQLLGKGDMLYMPSGKQLTRVHGPFVSDEEVRRVADHWRSQGTPDYVQSVTEEPEEGGFALDGQPILDDSPEEQAFRSGVQIVCESQKASISYLQRQLRVGYNTAARMMERMESEGVVSAPDHLGRRQVLRDRDGNPV